MLLDTPGKKYLFEVSERVSAGGTCAQTAFLLGAVCSASVGISALGSGACDPCSHYMNLEGGSEAPGGQQLHLAGWGRGGVRDGLIPPFGEAALVKRQRGHSCGHRVTSGKGKVECKSEAGILCQGPTQSGISPSGCSL